MPFNEEYINYFLYLLILLKIYYSHCRINTRLLEVCFSWKFYKYKPVNNYVLPEGICQILFLNLCDQWH